MRFSLFIGFTCDLPSHYWRKPLEKSAAICHKKWVVFVTMQL